MDLQTGTCFLGTEEKANSQTVAAYFHQLAGQYHQKGATQLTVWLDRNTTHGPKMRQALADLQPCLPILFLYVAAYSPKLNPVEYLIHHIRQTWLHHADPAQNLAQVKERLFQQVHQKVCFSPEQLINLLEHIDRSVP